MVKICPVSNRQMNENVARMNAFFTVLFVSGFFITGNSVFPVILFFDFLFRNIYEGRLNPVVHLNRYMVGVLFMEKRMINAGPKIFASRVGLLLSVLGTVLLIAVSFKAALVPFSILGIFSFLETAFGYCVACKLYPYFLPFNEKLETLFRQQTSSRT